MTEKLDGPSYLLEALSFTIDPSQDELIALTAKMPNARRTTYDNLKVTTRVDSRSAASTFIVSDVPDKFTCIKTISRN